MGTREGYIGVGLVGALVGALVAANVQTEPPQAAPAPAPTPATPVTSEAPAPASEAPADDASAGLMPLVLALEGAHKAIHERPATSNSVTELPTALADAVSADTWFPDLRAEFHRRVGPGIFVDARGLTPFY